MKGEIFSFSTFFPYFFRTNTDRQEIKPINIYHGVYKASMTCFACFGNTKMNKREQTMYDQEYSKNVSFS
jgi:hypothetical protein